MFEQNLKEIQGQFKKPIRLAFASIPIFLLLAVSSIWFSEISGSYMILFMFIGLIILSYNTNKRKRMITGVVDLAVDQGLVLERFGESDGSLTSFIPYAQVVQAFIGTKREFEKSETKEKHPQLFQRAIEQGVSLNARMGMPICILLLSNDQVAAFPYNQEGQRSLLPHTNRTMIVSAAKRQGFPLDLRVAF